MLLVLRLIEPDESAARRPVAFTIAAGNRAGGAILDVREPLEDGGLSVAREFTPPIHDPASLRELRDAIGVRGRLGLAVLQAEFDQVRLRFRAPKEEVAAAAQLLHRIGLLHLYEGRYPEAAACFQRALELGRPSDFSTQDRAQRMALLGICSMRQGEADNRTDSVGHSSDDPQIRRETVQGRQAGAQEAIRRFSAYLAEWPDDLRVRWLMNLAYMELGAYPDHVPNEYLIPIDRSASEVDIGRFEDVAPPVGLTARGPNPAGGSVFDDFDGDGLPDLFTTALDATRGASLFLNRGGVTFEDRSIPAGLAEQVYARNAVAADYDNDGDLDVLLLRGAGEAPLRLSLLANRGDGRFEDVTLASGLAEPIATGSAAWGDYDDDGRLDLFVCGEFTPSGGGAGAAPPDPRNRCRLYHNRGDGTFVDVAGVAGVLNERCAQGAAWGDYDDDGRLDLYVSNREGPGRLYHNEGDGTFRDRAPALGVTGPSDGSACWFWDYDNDGRLDLYVGDGRASLADIAAAALGRPTGDAGHPRLYRNLGTDGFREVARDVGLDLPLAAIGCNFADLDNDGFLDIYVGNGGRSVSGLVPNRMFWNQGGRRFVDVTTSSGTGSLLKGNSVSFADWDADGDLDLFVESGGVVPGDPSQNLLYRNPGHGRHCLKLSLVGTRTNRAAIGARIRVDVTSPDGRIRSIHRTVGTNSTSGGNGLVESIGLLDATRVATLTVRWPTSRTTQTFRDLDADQVIEIVEGRDSYRALGRLPSPVAARRSGRVPDQGVGRGPVASIISPAPTSKSVSPLDLIACIPRGPHRSLDHLVIQGSIFYIIFYPIRV
jgi:hypothetical protein